MKNIPRGLRNCNPLNIRRGSRWQGMEKVQNDPAFVQFRSMVFGYRAAFIIMRTYVQKHGCKTVRDIISRWAPPIENDTKRYAQFVANMADLKPDDPLPLFSNTKKWVFLLMGMTLYENGGIKKINEAGCDANVLITCITDAHAIVFRTEK